MPIDVSFFNTGTPISFAPFSVTPSKPPSPPESLSAAANIPVPVPFLPAQLQSSSTTTTRPETAAAVCFDDITSNHKALQVRALELQLQTERTHIAELEKALQATVASKEQVTPLGLSLLYPLY